MGYGEDEPVDWDDVRPEEMVTPSRRETPRNKKARVNRQQRLVAELAEARAEIERLGDVVSMYTDVLIAKDKSIAELEADVVWAVENGAREVRNEHRGKPGCRVIALAFDESNSTVDCDGTSADILRAVREARNGVS